jgi:hypothetical protein
MKLQPEADAHGNHYSQQQHEKQQLETALPPKLLASSDGRSVPLAH